jgi:hypothetical protein
MEIPTGQSVTIKLLLDPASAQAIVLKNIAADTRFNPNAGTETIDGKVWNFATLTFDDTNWFVPVRVGVAGRHDARPEDPQTAVLRYTCFDDATSICGVGEPYQIPNLRSGTGMTDVEVIDDDTPGLVVLESEGNTLVVNCAPPLGCSPVDPDDLDDYFLRLTQRPTAPVKVYLLTDGLTDIYRINGVVPTLEPIGGYIPSRLFTGNVTI